ncbi:phage terminase small subunit [Streptomyces tendae]
MAGMGPAPKAEGRKVRRNKDTIAQTVLRWERAEAPELPDFRIEKGDELVEFHWPERTREWWQMWKASPQAEHFGSSDWEYLLDTALIHARYWSGNLSLAGELRLRVAEFGATPSARARLRMVFAEADGADGGSGRSGVPSARERYGNLRPLPGGKARQA